MTGLLYDLTRKYDQLALKSTNINTSFHPSAEINQQKSLDFTQYRALIQGKIQILAHMVHMGNKNQDIDLSSILNHLEMIRNEAQIGSILDLSINHAQKSLADLYYSPRGLKGTLALQLALGIIETILVMTLRDI